MAYLGTKFEGYIFGLSKDMNEDQKPKNLGDLG